MTVWLLAVVLLVCGAIAGYSFGAIRAAFAFTGIMIGALTAGPLGRLIAGVFPALGVKNLLLQELLPPVAAFLIVLALVKSAGNFVAWKVDVYYRYKVSELRQALWRRLNSRLGLCLGILNAAVYFCLTLMVLYPACYFVAQVNAGDRESFPIRVLTRFGEDLTGTGCWRMGAALAPVPHAFYPVSDLCGLVYQNPALYRRLGRYPALLGFLEKSEVRDIVTDGSYTNLFVQTAPLSEILAHDRTKAIMTDKALLSETWNVIGPHIDDLRAYLETGVSPKFKDETLLGRWKIDVGATFAMMKRSMTNLTSRDLRMMKQLLIPMLQNTWLMATPDRKVKFGSSIDVSALGAVASQLTQRRGRMPGFPSQPTTQPQQQPGEPQTVQSTIDGRWRKQDGGGYVIVFSFGNSESELEASVENDRLFLGSGKDPMRLVMRRQ